jgi:hypothetical protein
MKNITRDKLWRIRKKQGRQLPVVVNPNNVQPQKCKHCPWRSDGVLSDAPIDMDRLKLMVLTSSNHLCHAPALVGKVEDRICRGSRDYQIEFYHALGVLDEPTDDAWARALDKPSKSV